MRDLWSVSERPEPGGEQVVWSLPNARSPGEAAGAPPDAEAPLPARAVVAASSAEGDLVVDPFAGSGTTGVAPLLAGRRFLAWRRTGTTSASPRAAIEPPWTPVRCSPRRADDAPAGPPASGRRASRGRRSALPLTGTRGNGLP